MASQPFQHSFDQAPALPFQIRVRDVRFPRFSDEFDQGMRRLPRAPLQAHALRRRHHGEAREDEAVTDEGQIVPGHEIGLLLRRVLDFVEDVPPIADQPLRDAVQGDHNVVPVGAARTIEHIGDGRIAHPDGERSHGGARTLVRRWRGLHPVEPEADAHSSPRTRCHGSSG